MKNKRGEYIYVVERQAPNNQGWTLGAYYQTRSVARHQIRNLRALYPQMKFRISTYMKVHTITSSGERNPQ